MAVVMVALFGHADGEEQKILVLQCLGIDNTQIAYRRPNSGLAGSSNLRAVR
jgi:hypothetical protein